MTGRFVEQAAELVAADAPMSGEHGDGRARSELLPIYERGRDEAMAAVKAVLNRATCSTRGSWCARGRSTPTFAAPWPAGHRAAGFRYRRTAAT